MIPPFHIKTGGAAAPGNDSPIRNDEQGTPTTQTSPYGLRGKILEVLSHVPFLQDLSVVKAYAEEVAQDRAQAFEAFMETMKHNFYLAASTDELTKHNLQGLTTPPPLSSASIETLS